MEKSLYSSSWYRVSHVRPRLRSHARIHRHHYRGDLWYVLQDRTSGRFHRFTPTAYRAISLMDGRHSVQEVWDLVCGQIGEDVLTQDEMIRLLAQLQGANVLSGDTVPDIEEIVQSADRQQRRKWAMSFMNPLAVRLPVVDPDEFLNATLPLVRPLMSWVGGLLFLVVVGYAFVLAGVHWSELTENLTDRVLAAENLMLLLLTYPFVKFWHELGHAYVVKKWGGEVHEIGIMFLVFMPVPYVDATDASSFHNKWRRAFVGAAGILVEIFLASLALFAWLSAEEGIARAFAFNVMLIGGVSTLLFNGNPLLRFDGYYVLSDILEIPNLGNRANRYIGYLIQRYLFGVDGVQSPVTARGEARWLFFYAIASFCYRVVIMTTIVLVVAKKFFVIGVLIAIWSATLMLVVPLAKKVWFLLTSPVLQRRRGRALAVTSGVLASLIGIILFLPLPYATVSEGIVWSADESAVYSGADGVAQDIFAAPNADVIPGEPLIGLEDPLMKARVRVLEAQVRELSIRYEAKDMSDPAEAKIIAEQLKHAKADLELEMQKKRDLVVRSPTAGRFILPSPKDIEGQFVRKGQVLGYVSRQEDAVVRVVIKDNEADLVRRRTNGVEVRFADQMSQVYPARVAREVPTLTDTLPSLALSTIGGGDIVVDPSDPQRIRVLANLLHLELELDASTTLPALGSRVYVRFSFGSEPVAGRLYRALRQVFLKEFRV